MSEIGPLGNCSLQTGVADFDSPKVINNQPQGQALIWPMGGLQRGVTPNYSTGQVLGVLAPGGNSLAVRDLQHLPVCLVKPPAGVSLQRGTKQYTLTYDKAKIRQLHPTVLELRVDGHSVKLESTSWGEFFLDGLESHLPESHVSTYDWASGQEAGSSIQRTYFSVGLEQRPQVSEAAARGIVAQQLGPEFAEQAPIDRNGRFYRFESGIPDGLSKAIEVDTITGEVRGKTVEYD